MIAFGQQKSVTATWSWAAKLLDIQGIGSVPGLERLFILFVFYNLRYVNECNLKLMGIGINHLANTEI